MSKSLTNPLQNIIKRASLALPMETGKVAEQQARIDRRRGQVVILADVSASMEMPAWGGRRKIDVLREAVAATRDGIPARLIAFSDESREVDSIPEPDANTNLTAGLKAALAHDPGVTLVISDGQPDRPQEALKLARQFRGVIDALYIGPETDTAAIQFMRDLTAAGGGNCTKNDITTVTGAKSLTRKIVLMLTQLPGPSA